MYLYQMIRAVPDLFFTFFPVFLVVLILSLLGKTSELFIRSDLILVASVLFAESWWRLRKAFLFRKGFMEVLGFMGAIVAVIVATLALLVEAGGIVELQRIVQSERFQTFQLFTEIAAIFYALLVRSQILEQDAQRLEREFRHLSERQTPPGPDV